MCVYKILPSLLSAWILFPSPWLHCSRRIEQIELSLQMGPLVLLQSVQDTNPSVLALPSPPLCLLLPLAFIL